ncbi:MAG TPA: hypothetical protein VJP39_06800 [Gaiellaceae bacterium]|nr:hypothetical protein [Gaiellaceae bacterium]
MRRIRIALVLFGVLALIGGGTALAEKSRGATHRDGPGPAMHGRGLFGAAVTYLGTTPQSLFTQLRSGKTLAQIANGTSGKSAAGLIAALVADAKQHLGTNAPSDLEQRITDFVNGKLPVRTGRPGFGRPRFPGLDVVTSYLGISNSDLLTQLRAGKTLAQIANATSGKSASGLIAALVADAKQRFGSNAPSDLEQRITDLVNGVHPQPPQGFPRHHGFFRPGGSSI